MVYQSYYVVNLQVFKRLEKIIFLLVFMGWTLFFIDHYALADAALTDLFKTKSFQGSWANINKFNWVGMLLNWAISLFCLMGLVMVIFRRVVSITYLAGKPFFDNVDEMKQAGAGGAAFGFGKMGNDIWRGNRGLVGTDAIMGVIYALMPNIRAYSDFKRDAMANNLTEDDTVITYIMKTFINTVALIFFFTIGFSGTLAQSYGVIVEGLAAAMDKAVTVNLDTMVTKFLSRGESYKFSIGSNNTSPAKFAEDISQDIYGTVLSRIDIQDTQTRLVIGKNVENWVWENILGSTYDITKAGNKLETLAKKGAGSIGKDNVTVRTASDVGSLSYDIVVNTSKTLGDTNGVSVQLKSFLKDLTTTANGDLADSLYFNLIIRKDKSTTANYFVVPTE